MAQAALKLRPATLDDVATVVVIDAALRPDMPTDPVVERYTWKNPEPGVTSEHWIAEWPAGHSARASPSTTEPAMKMETIVQAIELGVHTVRADNDERNSPMLHINEDLGYTLLPCFADYEKDL